MRNATPSAKVVNRPTSKRSDATKGFFSCCCTPRFHLPELVPFIIALEITAAVVGSRTSNVFFDTGGRFHRIIVFAVCKTSKISSKDKQNPGFEHRSDPEYVAKIINKQSIEKSRGFLGTIAAVQVLRKNHGTWSSVRYRANSRFPFPEP